MGTTLLYCYISDHNPFWLTPPHPIYKCVYLLPQETSNTLESGVSSPPPSGHNLRSLTMCDVCWRWSYPPPPPSIVKHYFKFLHMGGGLLWLLLWQQKQPSPLVGLVCPYAWVCVCVSVWSTTSVTADTNFLILSMMMWYDVGLIPIASKCSTVWYLRRTDKNICFWKKVIML